MNKKKSFMNLIEDIEGLVYATDPPKELYNELETLVKKVLKWDKEEEEKRDKEDEIKYGKDWLK